MSETRESIIKLEKVKEEPDVSVDDFSWATEIWDHSALREVKEEEDGYDDDDDDDDDDDELERPAAVFIKEEIVEEDTDPTFCAEFSVGPLKETGSFISGHAVAAGRSDDTRLPLGGATGCEGIKPFSSQGENHVHGCNETTGSGDLVTRMRRLVKIMLGKTPHHCSVCKKTFRERHNLVTHMRTHTGTPFPCDMCDMSFMGKEDLKAHMKSIHAFYGPFICSVCNKFFSRRTNLNIHMRIHTGERPYACTLCERTFTQKQNLDYHMKRSVRHLRRSQ